MSEIRNIDASVQFFYNNTEDWSDPSDIVPEGIWVFDTTNRVIYKGDGTHTVSELPVHWDMAQIEEAKDYYKNKFPHNFFGQDGQLLVVNSTSDKFKLGTLNINEIVYLNDFLDILSGISDNGHRHDVSYYTKEEIEQRLSGKVSIYLEKEKEIIAAAMPENEANEEPDTVKE